MRPLLLLTASIALVACTDGDPSSTSKDAAIPATEPTGSSAKTSAPKSDPQPDMASGKRGGKRSRGKADRGPALPKRGRPPSNTASKPSKVESDAGMLARCSDGQVVFGFWQGEYPSPVAQLDQAVQADVSDSPCAGPSRACMVKAGLLHPWAEDVEKSGQLTFATRTRTISYTLLKDHKLAGVSLKKGARVEVLSYLSEGVCAMQAGGHEQGAIEAMCPGTGANDSAIWKAEGDENPPSTQLVKVSCQGGPPGWLVVDDAFVGRRDVREGQMTGYGEVSRSK